LLERSNSLIVKGGKGKKKRGTESVLNWGRCNLAARGRGVGLRHHEEGDVQKTFLALQNTGWGKKGYGKKKRKSKSQKKFPELNAI